jgi:ATP-dependent RNA helicase DDX5/DBP2
VVPFLQFSTLPEDITSTPSPTSVKEYLAKHEISVSDPEAPPPVLSFESSGLPDYILSKLLKDFSAPTPIQAQGLPIALSGRNLVGIGQTGSGKTLAFLLPALLHIKKERERLKEGGGRGKSGPLALVLAPTRELAKQIEEVAMEFRKVVGIRTVCCIGGEPR